MSLTNNFSEVRREIFMEKIKYLIVKDEAEVG